MARPPLYDKALRDRLLESAAAIIDDKGPERISLRDVAHDAGTSTSAVYTLFGGKAELLLAVIEHGFRSFADAQAIVEPQGLRALGISYREWATQNPALYRLMFGGAILSADDCTPDGDALSSAILPLVRALATRVPEPEVMPSALIVWAQVHGAVSLEIAAVTPVEVDWDAVYSLVLDAVERAFPRQ